MFAQQPGDEPTVLPVAVDLPETFGYRLKRKLLGPPLVTEQLSLERLSNPIALGVLSPDCISSTAYGTEEMLNQLVPYVGLAAFTLVVPVTLAILVVLFFVTLSYREVVMVYTKAGGSYVVSRDNFGVNVAQVAAVALLIDYTLTVAVQLSAGTDAVVSAIPSLSPYVVPITVTMVVLIAWGNLRGIREAGRVFALPTYFFIAAIGLLVVTGMIRLVLGELHAQPLPPASELGYTPGTPGSGLLLGATVFMILRSFANGGSSLTGLEAISNGVSAFKPPEGSNARRVLVVMSVTLGTLVLGVSLIAHFTHAVPYAAGTPTVISQEAKFVFGSGVIGHVLYLVIQTATMLILYTGGNTSFNGFPFLASFVADDRFLPRQLTRRGHRLTFSNGIIVLAIVAIALILITRARLDALVSLYAIGVFTGFTMAGAGMVKHHLTHREVGWNRKIWINGSAAVLSATVVLIFAITKFTQGAWAVVVLFPVMVWGLIRLNRQYRAEAAALEEGSPRATEAGVLHRHVVLVFVDRLDSAVLRALQYAKTLTPNELRAVHFVLDTNQSEWLATRWAGLKEARVPLELIECPDRRLTRAALELVARTVADGKTEVSVLLPRRAYSPFWGRVLHDRTADAIAQVVSQLPHANATIVPFHLGTDEGIRGQLGVHFTPTAPARARKLSRDGAKEVAAFDTARTQATARGDNVTRIADVRWRQRTRVAGRIRSVRVLASTGTPILEASLCDASGELTIMFYGRRAIAGVVPGTKMVAEGTVGEYQGHFAIMNPEYELLATSADAATGAGTD